MSEPAPLRSEFAFEVRLEFGERLRLGPLPQGGACGYAPITGGSVSGPLLQGRVVPHSGGDWPMIWADGTFEFDARYVIEAQDGTFLYVQNRGFAHASPEVQARIQAGLPVDPAQNYFRTTPTFKAPAGPHAWLGRTVFVVSGEKHPQHSVFAFHRIL